MYKALIVDDEKAIHIAVRKLGNWKEFNMEEPESAWNGKEALQKMRESKINIVFVDMNMPVMNGSDFLKEASIEFPETKFIVISGYDDFRYAKTALQANALDYLLKPIAREELNNVISRAIHLLDESSAMQAGKNGNISETGLTPQTLPPAIKSYIDTHFSEDITLELLGNTFFFTKEYLSRLFKKRYSCGIYDYVLKVRMENAKKLLSSSNYQIQQIAYQTGYKDSNYFSKAFKSFYGISPTEFRTEQAR
ncbi:MAG: response regulator [Treponema sp.]|nr:response regulator [Treponema sp.]